MSSIWPKRLKSNHMGILSDALDRGAASCFAVTPRLSFASSVFALPATNLPLVRSPDRNPRHHGPTNRHRLDRGVRPDRPLVRYGARGGRGVHSRPTMVAG